jgi:hypothetical protein
MVTLNPAYDPIIAEAARRFNVPEATIRAVMAEESGGRPGSVSPKGAGGLMQIMPPTYNELAGKHGLGPNRFDPRNNIMGGAAYLRQMNDQFGGNWDDTFGAYNAGPARWTAVKAGRVNAPDETTTYIRRVNDRLGNPPPTVSINGPGFDLTVPTSVKPQYNFGNEKELQGLLDLEAPPSLNHEEGLGTVNNHGQTPSQSPRTDPAALPGTKQTDRLDLSGRINEMINQLSAPGGRPELPSQLQYMLAGAQGGVQKLAGIHDRPVGWGEILGAAGGGLTSGYFAGNEAQFKQRDSQFGELTNLVKMDEYQRARTTQTAKIQAAMRYAAQLRASGDPNQIAMADAIENDPSLVDNVIGRQAELAFPKPKSPKTVTTDEGVFVLNDDGTRGAYLGPPVRRTSTAGPKTVTLGDGPKGPGVYVLNPNGTIGERLGASETAPGVEITTPLTPEQAQQAGLPAPPQTSPYSNPNLSPRGRSNLVSANVKSWEKRAADNAEAARGAQTLIGDMRRFKFLNEKVNREGWYETGGTSNTGVAGTARGWFNDDIKEMQSITARITPTLRQPGSGATSDFDARMFQAGTVGIDKTKTTNDNIATATIVAGENMVARAQFEQAYFDAYQHTGGMEAAWQRYLNANPIFDPTAQEGSYKLNDNRQTWQEFFQNGEKPREKPAETAPASGGNATVPPPPPGAVIVGRNPVPPPGPGTVIVPVQ